MKKPRLPRWLTRRAATAAVFCGLLLVPLFLTSFGLSFSIARGPEETGKANSRTAALTVFQGRCGLMYWGPEWAEIVPEIPHPDFLLRLGEFRLKAAFLTPVQVIPMDDSLQESGKLRASTKAEPVPGAASTSYPYWLNLVVLGLPALWWAWQGTRPRKNKSAAEPVPARAAKLPLPDWINRRTVLASLYLALLITPLILNFFGYSVNLRNQKGNHSYGPALPPETNWGTGTFRGRHTFSVSLGTPMLFIMDVPAVELKAGPVQFSVVLPKRGITPGLRDMFRWNYEPGSRLFIAWPYPISIIVLGAPAVIWAVMGLRQARAKRRREEELEGSMASIAAEDTALEPKLTSPVQ